MKLIADSGSTKTDWRLINQDKIIQFQTVGLNPVYKQEEELFSIIGQGVLDNDIDANQISEVHFYGAGCMGYEKAEVIKGVLVSIFDKAITYVNSDILAAARATSQTEKGIVSILGTGANVCVFDGNEITYTRSGLGYVLGDEGSGAHIGKTFVKAILDENLPKEICERFFSKFHLSKAAIIDAVYRQSNPNLFLAQFSKYVFQLKHHPEIEEVIISCFKEFFDQHILKIENYKDYKLHVVGSVGFYYADYIRRLANQYQINIGSIIEKPIAGLTLYHQD